MFSEAITGKITIHISNFGLVVAKSQNHTKSTNRMTAAAAAGSYET